MKRHGTRKENDENNGNKTLKMYFVATIQDLHSTPYPLKETTRVVGYFLDLEDAVECVEGNWGDLYEAGYYKYAVIEDVEPGIYQSIHSHPLFISGKVMLIRGRTVVLKNQKPGKTSMASP